MIISSIKDIIHDIKNGQMVILVDEENRENEGDLLLAADFVTPETINFMATHGRGLICLTLTEAHCRQLNLPLMVSASTNHVHHWEQILRFLLKPQLGLLLVSLLLIVLTL